MDRAYGKPRQTHEVQGEPGPPPRRDHVDAMVAELMASMEEREGDGGPA